MPFLGPDDRLATVPRRVAVTGTSGSGKSTLARRYSQLTGSRYVELDALFHGPGWTKRPTFEAEVEAFTSEPEWVTEWGGYATVRPMLTERADAFVWLDLPRATVMRQVVRRTVERRIRRTELWSGNTEPPLHTFFTDPDHIVRWSWRTYRELPGRIADAARHNPGLPIVRLRSHDEADRWLDSLPIESS